MPAAGLRPRAPRPDDQAGGGASGTIRGLTLGVGHRSLTERLARHAQLPIVTSRNSGQGASARKEVGAEPLTKQRRLPDAQIRTLLGCTATPTHKTCLALMYA